MNNEFTLPKRKLSPFYQDVNRIPRKLKKRIKIWCDVHWSGLTNEQRLWYYLECTNIEYRDFLISKICDDE